MKILDRYILKSFISTLATVFAILYFIFILQAVWLFISELAGKDLDVFVVVQFLILHSPKMVPLVLPLSVLLASIMTFGSLAENYEFAAMKASGISLKRAMYPLTVFIFVLAGISFWFANSVIPKAEYEFINLRRDIAKVKPAMAIAAGQFNEIGNANIKVDKKSGENGRYLENVTMHMRNATGFKNEAIIRSVDGELVASETSNILQLHLYDGNYYRDLTAKTRSAQAKHPFVKVKFEQYTVNMDLAALNNTDAEEDRVSDTYQMLNISQLNHTIDSLQTVLQNEKVSNIDNMVLRTDNLFTFEHSQQTYSVDKPVRYIDKAPKDILSLYNKEDQRLFLLAAKDYASNLSFNADSNDLSILNQIKKINEHYLALNAKFVIAYCCFLMFFIGAPLGAIIRKGGLGLPMVFAVMIFIIYHFINTFGTKVASEDGMPPIIGSWLSPAILTPLAIYLTYKATKDNGDVNFMVIFDPIVDFVSKLFKKNKEQTESIDKALKN